MRHQTCDILKQIQICSNSRFTSNHPDNEILNPILSKFLIIGGKYDLFHERYSPEQCKVICKTLRFVAHYYGGSLYFYSEKSDLLSSRLRY